MTDAREPLERERARRRQAELNRPGASEKSSQAEQGKAVERVAAAAHAQADAGERFVDACKELRRAAAELADAETEYRVARARFGRPTLDARGSSPDARALAADVALAALAPLRPHVPFVTAESGRRAAEQLTIRPDDVG